MFNKVLKKINSAPFVFTMRHFYPFYGVEVALKDNELNSANSWDFLRANDPHFSIALDREEWLMASENKVKKDGQDGKMIERAKYISEIVKNNNSEVLFSVGSGGAGVEYQIKKNIPNLRMVCSEYAEDSVRRLKNVFLEAEDVIFFDILKSSWNDVKNKYAGKNLLVFMYRIDINFSDEEMKDIFIKLHDSKIDKILIILCGRLTIRGIFNRFFRRIKWVLTNTKYVFAGYVRTEKTYISFWDKYYEYDKMDFEGLQGFLLKRKVL